MSDPVPLLGPDGRSWAWACGRCNRVWVPGHTLAPVEDVDQQAESCLRDTEACCVCRECGAPVEDDLRGDRCCARCDAAQRERNREHRAAWAATLAERGVRVCPECYDLRDGCEVCGGTGEVPL